MQKKMDALSIAEITSKLDAILADLATKATSTELNNILVTIQEKEERISELEKNVVSYKSEISQRDTEIAVLRTRIDSLESRFTIFQCDTAYTRVTSDLNSRLIDDHQQISRKVNLRIEGVEVASEESPTSLMGYIKSECDKLNLCLEDFDFDRCHRNGPPIKSKDGKIYQCILLKLCSWRARDTIYKNRKSFSFKINHDLTKKTI